MRRLIIGWNLWIIACLVWVLVAIFFPEVIQATPKWIAGPVILTYAGVSLNVFGRHLYETVRGELDEG